MGCSKKTNAYRIFWILVFSTFFQSKLVFAINTVEADAPLLESEEALARSDAARIESSEAQKDLEQERINSAPVLAKAKELIQKAEADEKQAIQDRLATEKLINENKRQLTQLESQKRQKEQKMQLAKSMLKQSEQKKSSYENQKQVLVDQNSKLQEQNQSLAEKIRDENQKQLQLAGDIRKLKIEKQRQLLKRKALLSRIEKERHKTKKFQTAKASFR